ncbi:MAG TPA: MerR family transcriptional regulator [Gemmatimonadales bacterium]|jgi:DNA-binding transcriptional MerR regulator/methylmalonyl-CoA mutase cobalamin-binding subunit|nr:MerR family transcriptional regulator [Gemmatimonadales bacterium]
MTSMTTNRTYEIHEVAELTGLATARLRAWERRYEVVRPTRQANRYRTYTAEQVALLRAFARLCLTGERIGELVRQPREALIARAEGLAVDNSPLSVLLDQVKRLDRQRLARLLEDHRKRLDPVRFGREIVLPLSEVVGDLWALGKLSVAAEHLASEVVVHQLKADLAGSPVNGPLLQAACLPGEHHEWGFLVTLIELKSRGWRVHYLGADLPLKDLADAAWTVIPRVVALSSADPANLEAKLPELRRLPRLLPPGTTVVVGGQGTDGTAAKLRRAGLRVGIEAIPEPRLVSGGGAAARPA